MRKFLQLLGIVTMTATAYGQADTDIVNIPDANFKRELLISHREIDTNGDREISYGEARAYRWKIYLDNQNISDLTGIEAFVNIQSLSVNNNKLTSLDLSKNKALMYLHCVINPLTNLYLNNNVVLKELILSDTKLTTIDLSNNIQLEKLYIDRTPLSNIDLYKNTKLKELNFSRTNLKSLDITNNPNLERLYGSESYSLSYLNLANGNNSKLNSVDLKNTNLKCIIIDAGFIPSNWYKDDKAKYKYYSCDDVYVHIPDSNLKKLLVDNKTINIDEDNEISYNEAKAYAGSFYFNDISDLTGLESFVNITELSIYGYPLPNLDIKNNTQLKRLNINNSQVKYLDISKNTALRYINLQNNQLTYLDISKNILLEHLYCNNNQLTYLDISKNVLLEYLSCSNNKLISLDLSNNLVLKGLNCDNNDLAELNVNKNIDLLDISAKGNLLTEIKLDNLSKLKYLNVDFNSIGSIDVSYNTELTHLSIERNKLKYIDLDNLHKLQFLALSRNSLSDKTLKLNNHSLLDDINIENTEVEVVDLRNYTKYTNSNISIGNKVKCVEVDNPNRSRAWNIVWQSGYENNYQVDCNEYLSTNEKSLAKEIKVINPVKDNLIIKTDAKVERIEIYNTAGQLVKVLFKGNTNVQDLPKGTYLIKITTDQGVRTEKIIKG